MRGGEEGEGTIDTIKNAACILYAAFRRDDSFFMDVVYDYTLYTMKIQECIRIHISMYVSATH